MNRIVSVLIANLYEQSTFRSQMVSQLLQGFPVTIIEKTTTDWYLVKGPDNYEGFIQSASLDLPSKKFKLKQIYSLQHTESGYLLPNSFVFTDSTDRNFFHPVTFEKIELDSTKLSDEQYLHQYINAPYLWGGRSVFGIDCSGLSQSFYEFKGITLPRNSYMQATLGNEVSDLKAGDLAFFREGKRIDHVGIMLNETEMIHSRTFVQVNNIIEKSAKNYSKRLADSFVLAKRYL